MFLKEHFISLYICLCEQIVFRKSELKHQKSISFHFEEIWQRFLATTKVELYVECTQSKTILLWPQRVSTLARVEMKQTGNCNLPSINKTAIYVIKTPHISSAHVFLGVGRTKGFTKEMNNELRTVMHNAWYFYQYIIEEYSKGEGWPIL